MRVWVRWSAYVCLSLLLWTAVAESTHIHPNQTESASCLICVAAHSASPVAISGTAAPVFAAVGMLHDQAISAHPRLDFADAGIRAPPAVL